MVQHGGKMRVFHHNRQTLIGPLIFVVIILYSLAAGASGFSTISINQLKLILDSPEIVVIDVRSSKDWQSSSVKIKGAVRGAPKNFESWAYDFSKDKAIVLY